MHEATTACGTTIDPDATALLVTYGGNDLGLLAGELQKLAAFTNGAAIGRDAIEAVTGMRPGRTLGDLLDHVAERETQGNRQLIAYFFNDRLEFLGINNAAERLGVRDINF